MVKNGSVDSLYYTYCDYQGNLLAVTDDKGKIKERLAYDPWGLRRNPDDWTKLDNGKSFLLSRGYTMHEHLDDFGLINMNGRVYDPVMAQFLSPDPFIQAPGNWYNYNRYGYCLNNPMLYTDPSGNSVILGMLMGLGYNYIKSGFTNLNNGLSFKDAFSFKNTQLITSTYYGIDNQRLGSPFWDNYQRRMIGDYSAAVVEGGLNQMRFSYGLSTDNWMNWGQEIDWGTRGSASLGGASNSWGSWVSDAWNSDIARLYIPDVVYVNGSGVLAFLGGGGADVGLALPLRGQDAGKVYLYGTLKGKAGLHGGVGVNFGRSNYLGPVNLFDFDATFVGKSAGIEGDYVIGASISVSEYDQYGNALLSVDVGVGPAIGGSVNIGAVTYATPLFKLW